MSLTNPTAIVTAMSASLDACAAWQSASPDPEVAAWPIYYPDSPPDAAYPHAVIEPGETTRGRLADGSIGLLSGSAAYRIHLAGQTVGQTETLAETLCSQLADQPTGLMIQTATHSVTAEPLNSEHTLDDEDAEILITSIEIQITYGTEG
jgi:hypothetical protein